MLKKYRFFQNFGIAGVLLWSGAALADSNTCSTAKWNGQVNTLDGNSPPFPAADIISNDVMRITPEQAQTGYYWTVFSLPLPNVGNGDNAKLEAKVKNPSEEGGLSAYDTAISFEGQPKEDGSILSAGVTFMGEQWAQSYDGLYVAELGASDVPELVQSMSDWHDLAIETSGGYAFVYYDGKEIMRRQYTGSIGAISKINIVFKGSGSVDSVNLYSSNKLLVEDLFTSSTSLQIDACKPKSFVIQGTAPWGTPHAVTCENTTQNTSVTIRKTKTAKWDCEKAGLDVKSGDEVTVTIKGKKY